jgi:hypothetical protein
MGVPQRELKLIDEARAMFAERFPTGRFEDPSWDVRHFRKTQHRKTNAYVYFTEYGSTVDPLHSRFGNIVKACVLLVDEVVASMPLRVDTFRMLWEALRVRTTPSQFSWSDLQETDLLEAEQQMLNHWGESATQKRCSTLLRLINYLSATPYGPIVRPLHVTFRTPRQEDFERYTIAGQELRNAKMPADEALNAIADMFQSTVTDESDRLILCLIAILIATGWYGLRFYKEENTKGDKYLDVIWLKGSMVDLGDLWSIFDFINPGLLGSAQQFTDFTERLVKRPHNPYGPLRELIRPYILRRLKTDKAVISDLPDKTEVTAFCSLSRKQAALYQDTVDELASILHPASGIQRKGLVLSFLMRFKQICNHPSQWLGDDTWAESDSGKWSRLRDIAEVVAVRQEKMLVFTQFREVTTPVADFSALSSDVQVWSFTGEQT